MEAVKPTSPKVEFEVTNNNIIQSSPLTGITFVAAVTTEGNINDPSVIVKTYGKFKELYGEEIVPDGTISNIEIALKMGSTLRISKVKHTGEGTSTRTTSADWIAALESLKEYDEGYQLVCSHINQYFKTSAEGAELDKVHIAAADRVKKNRDMIYFVEIPKYKISESDTKDPMDAAGMITWAKALQEKLNNSPYIAYFAGGWKYYDNEGILQNCDTIGTIIGLADASASNYGPWYSFAGMTRGRVKDARGLVSPNYGADALYEKINELANNYINVSVVKDTRLQGKQPMLWHNFTSSNEGNSFQFLGIVRLIIYLKKVLKPIMDSYLEEPNTFSTWNIMYYDVKLLLDDLVTNQAITEYHWYGDQDATNYDEMTINKEADVRNGKYRVELHFKDIVALQNIIVGLMIDKSEQSTSVEVASNNSQGSSPSNQKPTNPPEEEYVPDPGL